MAADRDDWAVHQPRAWDAPIPGTHWYSGCDPDRPRVNPATGRCESCGEAACAACGREACPDHPAAAACPHANGGEVVAEGMLCDDCGTLVPNGTVLA